MRSPNGGRASIALVRFVLALAGSSLPAQAWAEVEASAPPAMSLTRALAFARAHQPTLRSARERLAAAQADTNVYRAQWLPMTTVAAEVLEGTANNSTASYLSVADVGLPRIGATRTNTSNLAPYASTLVGLGLEQEVFDFGRIAAETAVGDALTQVQRHRTDEDWMTVKFIVSEAYFAVLAAHEVVKASEQAYERARTHRDEAQAKVQAQLWPPVNLTRAEADLTRYDVGRIRARGSLDSAMGVFAAAVGVPQPLLDAASGTEQPAPLPALDSVLSRAVAGNPGLAVARARTDASRAVTRAVAAEGRPNLFLSASVSGRQGGAPPTTGAVPDGNGWVPDIMNWDAALVLRWPLFDGVLNARVDAARQRERVAQADLDGVRRELLADVQRAYSDASVADASLVALQRGVTAALANYTQVEARFNGGLATTVELADAEAVRTQAEIDLAIGHFQAARARAALSRLMMEQSP